MSDQLSDIPVDKIVNGIELAMESASAGLKLSYLRTCIAIIRQQRATIKSLEAELRSVIATANAAQSKYDLVCYALGMVGSAPTAVVDRIREMQDKSPAAS